jgi:cytochrome c-type biogenesis protein CcmH
VSVAKSRGAWAVLGLVIVTLLVVGASGDGGPSTSAERVDRISRRIACPVCDGESVYESQNPASVNLRSEIRRQVELGVAGDDEIVDYIQQRFGGQVLLVPKASGIDALVWVLPVVALVCAVAGLAFAFRRWQRAADTVPDDEDRSLVAAALRAEPPSEAGDDVDDQP